MEVSAGEGTASFDLMIAAGSGFGITAAPAVGYAPPTGSTTYAVEVAPEMGFTQTVTLSASGLPANVMAAFNPATLTAPYQATSTLTLTTDGASVGTTAVTITGTGGGLSATTPVELRVVPQPTTYHITPEEGYVGAHTVTLTVGNGANMDLDLRYTLNGLPHTGTIPLDANGQWSYISTRADVIGTYVYTGMRNALLTEWVTIDDTYTPRPPQPTTMTMTVDPASLIPPGNYTMTVGNGAGMTLDVQYTHTPPGGTADPVTTIENWPILNAVGGGSTDGTVSVQVTGCTLPGAYRYTQMRNTRNSAWVDADATVTINSPVSVMSVSPSGSVPPATGGSPLSIDVTITGEHLCGIALTTTYPGLTISNVMSDGVLGAGQTATATFTIAPGTTHGIAEIEAATAGGSTTFHFVIGNPTPVLTLSPSAAMAGEDPDAQPIGGAPANAGGSVAVTVTVVPAPASGTRYSGCNIRAVATGTTAGPTDYHITASGRAIRAVESWAESFTFWVIDDTDDDDDETLILEAFCTGSAPNNPPPVAAADLLSTELTLTIVDNDLSTSGQSIYFKRDHIYEGPGGSRVAIVTPLPADPTAAAAPTGLSHSNLTATSVHLSWTGATDTGGSGLAGYKIYRGQVPVGTATGTSFTDQHLQPNTAYSYTVRAFDNAQNHSPASNAVSFTTPAAPPAPQE